MRANRSQLKRYVSDLAVKLWSLGAELEGEPELVEDSAGNLGFSIAARMPDSGTPQHALLSVDEIWTPRGAGWERSEYAYDLIDYARDRRRAYHLHDAERFASAYDVLVHEHCEAILGAPDCSHYYGEPVTDGYSGVDLLLLAWTDDSLDCSALRCLDAT